MQLGVLTCIFRNKMYIPLFILFRWWTSILTVKLASLDLFQGLASQIRAHM